MHRRGQAAARAMVIGGVLAALAGCKIEITSPGVGYVADAEGETVCQPGERCVVDVRRFGTFEETYVGVPTSGYEFIGWRKRHRGFCGGSVDACRLTSEPIKANPDLAPILDSDEVFYLEPMFRPIESVGSVTVCETAYLGGDFEAGDTIRLGNNARVRVDAEAIRYFSTAEDYILSYFPSGHGSLVSMEDDPEVAYVTVLEPPRQCNVPARYTVGRVTSQGIRIGGYDYRPATFDFGSNDTTSCEGITSGDDIMFLDGAPDGWCNDATIQEVGGYQTCTLQCS